MKEIRAIETEFEIKQEGEEEKPVINGYAALFNSQAPETNGFIEKIARGAFEKAIEQSDPLALFNHNMEKVLGRKSAGTLQLREDEKGLYYEVDPPDTSYANDLIESLKRGDINQSSFGFIVSKEKWDDGGEIPVRTILEVDELIDVSPVTRAWYPQTVSGIKSKEDVLNEFRQKREDIIHQKEKQNKSAEEKINQFLIKNEMEMILNGKD